ncbi:MAG: hypothetical protein K8I03_08170 [Ignavibacteria bacterium]|nr:hypothetical protein [Ignavibacteria bacterium]
MLNKIILLISLFSFLTAFSQEKIIEYKEPAVLEGSNLSVYVYPNLNLTNEITIESDSKLSYYLGLSSAFTKWRFTERVDYSVSAVLGTLFAKNSFPTDNEVYSSGDIAYSAGASYYLLKNKLFAGLYSTGTAFFGKGHKPDFSGRFNPYIGYGRIKDAFIVNETSNFEKVLLDEKYLSKSFDKKTRLILNSILDKRNGNVFRSLFKDDDEIVFFTELEKFLLDEKVINKPLNARTTMKLYQTLYNRNFVLFPLYKGYQFQAELSFRSSNARDTIIFPKTLTLSAAYGLPLSIKTSMLFSTQFVFPLNSNFNRAFYETDMHNPVFMRSEFQNISNYSYVNPGYIFLDAYLYDYKAAAEIYVFHYLNNTAGVIGSFEFSAGKRKEFDNKLDYELDASTMLVLNIINKLRLDSGIFYSFDNNNKYELSFGSRISYYVF